MIKKTRLISVKEFETIYADTVIDGVHITKDDILDLRKYIDVQNSGAIKNKSSFNDFMRPVKNGVQVNNYVGVIQTSSGLTIEVLPKIYGSNIKFEDKVFVREIFLKMIKTVRHIDGKEFNLSHLSNTRSNVLEIFISMFLSESNSLLKKGLISNYVSIQNNEKFLKGKLLMSHHLRKNLIDKSKFYNEYDMYIGNTVENQIIKTTLEFLRKISQDNFNLRTIREQLQYFEEIDTIRDSSTSFKKVKLSKSYKYYEQVLAWCDIFLKQMSFTGFKGSSSAFAILFPMEKIFESYVSKIIKKHTNKKVILQEKLHMLFDETPYSQGGYRLKPDIVIRDKLNEVIIVDAKWKLLDQRGPSQSDLYQMYSYFTRYTHNGENVKKVIILYPYTPNYNERNFISTSRAYGDIAAKIEIRFVDLYSILKQDQLFNIL